MIEVEVDSIRVSLMNQQRIVVLKDIHDERYLPIFIGQFEADAITLELQEGRPQQRPFTHDLLQSVIVEMGGHLEHILVNDLRNETFYARLVISVDGKQTEVDSRPSDAIALAVRAKAPIFVNEAVMDKTAVVPEEDIFESLTFEDEDGFDNLPDLFSSEPETPERETVDESALSAFADFVNNSLDFEDLDEDE